jgi:hypothetical protein
MAAELKFLIDNVDRGQPLNPEDFGITINEDSTIGARIVSFDSELIFGGDVFTYLYNKLATSGYCELVRVSVQYLCNSGTWEKLVDGYIIVTESNFLLDKCQVKTKLYDETFSTKINNNKNIPFSLRLTTSKNGAAITPPTAVPLYVFNPGVIIYPNPAYAYTVYDVFAHLVNCMSDGLIDFDSNFFAASYPQADVAFYTNGQSIRTKSNVEILANFQDLYLAMRSKLNLGMGFEKQANGRPLLRIEPIAYFQQSTASASLYDQPDIEMRFDTSSLYQAAEFGNELYLEVGQCNNGDTLCEFTQTPFRGFRAETFGFLGQCNTSNMLNLKTSEIIFDTNLIQDIVVFDNTGYETNGVIIQSNWTGSQAPNTATANGYDPYLVGNTIYNGSYRNEVVSANWLSGYPNSLLSFFEGFSPVTATGSLRFDATLANEILNRLSVVNAPIQNTVSGTLAHYFIWLDPVVNPNNFTQPVPNTYEYYIVSNPGIYTVNAGLVLGEYLDPITFAPIGFAAGRQVKLMVKRFDSGLNLLETRFINGSDFAAATGQPAWYEINNQIFICEAGDYLAIDIGVSATNIAGYSDVLQPFLRFGNNFQNSTLTSGFSYFSVLGQPFTPQTLDPVNIDDVQAYLYKFNRPLTMAEINAITSETSKPILLGRKDDALAVAPTYIKTINIESVMRKGAQFELRSNKLLP